MFSVEYCVDIITYCRQIAQINNCYANSTCEPTLSKPSCILYVLFLTLPRLLPTLSGGSCKVSSRSSCHSSFTFHAFKSVPTVSCHLILGLTLGRFPSIFISMAALVSSLSFLVFTCMGSGGRAVERRTINRGDRGSIPPIAISKLPFRSSHIVCLFRKRH